MEVPTPYFVAATTTKTKKVFLHWHLVDEFDQSTGAAIGLRREHLDALRRRGAVLDEQFFHLVLFQSRRGVEEVEDLRRGLDAILRGHFRIHEAVVLVAHEVLREMFLKLTFPRH